MPTKYVWWDDKRSDPPTRMELRPPQSLHDFTKQVAELHGVSVNAFVVALMQWAYTEDRARRLKIEVEPSRVRVTAQAPAPGPESLPSQLAKPDRRRRYKTP